MTLHGGFERVAIENPCAPALFAHLRVSLIEIFKKSSFEAVTVFPFFRASWIGCSYFSLSVKVQCMFGEKNRVYHRQGTVKPFLKGPLMRKGDGIFNRCVAVEHSVKLAWTLVWKSLFVCVIDWMTRRTRDSSNRVDPKNPRLVRAFIAKAWLKRRSASGDNEVQKPKRKRRRRRMKKAKINCMATVVSPCVRLAAPLKV